MFFGESLAIFYDRLGILVAFLFSFIAHFSQSNVLLYKMPLYYFKGRFITFIVILL